MSKMWTCDPEVSLRRFNPRGNPYQISHDRYVSSANQNSHRESSRNYTLASHDNSNTDYDADQDSSKNARRRIPVAVRASSLCYQLWCCIPWFDPANRLQVRSLSQAQDKMQRAAK